MKPQIPKIHFNKCCQTVSKPKIKVYLATSNIPVKLKINSDMVSTRDEISECYI